VGRFWESPRARRIWTLPFALALVSALAGGIVDVGGVIVLLVYAVACRAASRAVSPALSMAAHALMLLVCAALMLHVLTGFRNPQILSQVQFSPDGLPYTQYLNFDKASAGLFLLGLYAPDLVARDDGFRRSRALAWRFGVLLASIIALSLALGFVRWDPKLPPAFPLWALVILFFTALPEEALFRGVVQTLCERRVGTTAAIAIAAVLFGLAHMAGGPVYATLAAVAGAGYGWIFARTRSIGAAIVAHAGIDAVHFLFFTYPALALHVR
jgi:membrane protease YdiL (CAAX protease family)